MKLFTHKSNHKTGQLGRCQQQGNTLVPVVIGLAIAAIATVTFLNQGQGLVADNNRLLATNELTDTLASYNTIRATGVGVNDVKKDHVPGLGNNNIYGKTTTKTDDSFEYTTDSGQTCQQLAATFKGADGVSKTECKAPDNSDADAAKTILNITLK